MNTINFDRGCTIAPIFRGEMIAPDWCIERFVEALDAGAAAAAEEVFHQWCSHPEWGDELTISISKNEEELPKGFRRELWDRGIKLLHLYKVEWLSSTCVVLGKEVLATSPEDALRVLYSEEKDLNPEATGWPRVV